MSKIICDVCGTSYPETATQCPICGCVRSSDAVAVAGDTSDMAAKQPSTYTYVKGGRFSKANVKKRNSGKPIYNAEPPQKANQRPVDMDEARVAPVQEPLAAPSAKPAPAKNSANKNELVLVIAIVALLLAIAGVVIYIACSFLVGNSADETPEETQQTQSSTTTETSVATGECTSVKFAASQITLTAANEAYLLAVTTEPAGQDFEFVFESDNPAVATVDTSGKVVAISKGTANITVRCGNVSDQCLVICDIPEIIEPTEPTEPTEPIVTYTEEDLTFVDNGWGYDYSIPLSQGTYLPYTGNIPAELVEFRSSDDTLATVSEDGTVTFLKTSGNDYVLIYAKYEEWEISCKIRIT